MTPATLDSRGGGGLEEEGRVEVVGGMAARGSPPEPEVSSETGARGGASTGLPEAAAAAAAASAVRSGEEEGEAIALITKLSDQSHPVFP